MVVAAGFVCQDSARLFELTNLLLHLSCCASIKFVDIFDWCVARFDWLLRDLFEFGHQLASHRIPSLRAFSNGVRFDAVALERFDATC